MNAWQRSCFWGFVGFVWGFWVIPSFMHNRSEATGILPLSNQEYHQQAEQRAACRKARVTFFEKCMKGDESYANITKIDCEAEWASLHGHVFDGDPRNYIVDEIDCGAIK